MSLVTVQVGQCGNQVGAALFAKLAEEADAGPDDFRRATREVREYAHPHAWASLTRCAGVLQAARASRWLNLAGVHCARGACRYGAQGARLSAAQQLPRARLMPLPRQVVANTLRAPLEGCLTWAYNERGTLAFQSGSGNNWARGYNTYGPQCRERVCELVRREVRRVRTSLLAKGAHPRRAGGGVRPPERLPVSAEHGGRHGRGPGHVHRGNCAVRHRLRSVQHLCLTRAGSDEHPNACVLSHCVWPYESGEVIVQNYNTLLTLASLLDAADGVVLVQNEALHAAANKLMNIARRAAPVPMRAARLALTLVLSAGRRSTTSTAWRLAALPPPFCQHRGAR